MKEKLFKIIMAVTIVPGAAAAAAIVAFALNDHPQPGPEPVPPVVPSGVVVTPETLTLEVDGRYQLKAKVAPEDAPQDVVWSSSEPSIATVDSGGWVTAKCSTEGVPPVQIMATSAVDEKLTGVCLLTITSKPIFVEQIIFDQYTMNLNVAGESEIKATVLPAGAPQTLSWSSSDDKVATVDNYGKVKALKTGTATIRATATDGSGKFADCHVTVTTITPERIELDPTEIPKLVVGHSKTIRATVLPQGAPQQVTWTSSDESIATVNDIGLVTAKGVGPDGATGSATITATSAENPQIQKTCVVSTYKPSPTEGFNWEVIDEEAKTAKITSYEGEASDVEIPSLVIDSTTSTQYTIVKIGEDAFKNDAKIQTCVIPPTVKEIGAQAFYQSRLTTIEVPSTVDKIGDKAFYRCNYLITAIIQAKEIGSNAFNSCDTLQNITLGMGVEEVGKNAFANNLQLKIINISKTVTNIDSTAFERSNKDLEIIIVDAENQHYTSNKNEGNCLINIDKKELMLGCKNTKIPTTGVEAIGAGAFRGCQEWLNPNIPEGVVYIYNDAFFDCVIKKLLIPASVSYIHTRAFAGSFNDTLTSIKVAPGNIGGYTSAPLGEECNGIFSWTKLCFGGAVTKVPNGITSIAQYALSGSSFSEFNIPDSVVLIGEYAFENCENLKRLVIPNVEAIPSYICDECNSLEYVELGSGVRELSFGCFDDCDRLKHIKINEGLTTIPYASFYNMPAIEEINLPHSLTTVENFAFCCRNVKKITFNGTKEELKTIFKDVTMAGEPSDWVPFVCTDGAFNIKGDSILSFFYDISINNGGSVISVEGPPDKSTSGDVCIKFDSKGKKATITAKQQTEQGGWVVLSQGTDYFVDDNNNTITISASKWPQPPEKQPIYFDIKLN